MSRRPLASITLDLDGATAAEVLILVRVPYDHPGLLRRAGKDKALGAIIDRLLDRGLLERHPESPHLYRCTEAGEIFRQSFVAAVRKVVPS